MATEEHPRTATTASIDARVGRLEIQFDSLDRKVDDIAVRFAGIESTISHISQLLTTQHQAMTAEVALIRQRSHDLANSVATGTFRAEESGRALTRIEAVLEKQTETQADPNASIAGRALLARIADVERDQVRDWTDHTKAHDGLTETLEEVTSETRTNRLWIATATGVIGAIVFLVNLVGPAIRAWLHLAQ